MEDNTRDCCQREELMQKVQSYEFAINELALYLDTHPKDEKALNLTINY